MPTLAAENGPVVGLPTGQLRGSLLNGIVSFKGVPYAANPFTTRARFRAPQPVTAWTGVRDATDFGRPPPQPGRDTPPTLFGGADDLTLNIWTPDPEADGLPVMVWLPGGAFIRADAGEAAYDGARFAAGGVVLVTVNYRVGVDGFMAIEGAPPNRGILDQIAALEWVRDNIAAFGGDPANVTLFGQSAGAESVGILLALPRTEGLFRRAILQSPPMQAVTTQEATRLATALAGMLGLRPTIADLSGVSLEALTDAAVGLNSTIKDRATWGRLSLGGTAFLPIVDGALLDASPLAMLERSPKPDVPVMVGSADQEARLYTVPNGDIDKVTQAHVDQLVGDLKLPAEAVDLYGRNPANRTPGDVYSALQSDYTFRMPALRIRTAQRLRRRVALQLRLEVARL
ncbi:carboxylesterase/lipase family protein [Hansschlegelia beijingensis]|uniref:carboxylesterase/lipase family protein n=1 Tax=Hansschlegelia beijingensis TaxID=1133344 RepID=UPI00387F3208